MMCDTFCIENTTAKIFNSNVVDLLKVIFVEVPKKRNLNNPKVSKKRTGSFLVKGICNEKMAKLVHKRSKVVSQSISAIVNNTVLDEVFISKYSSTLK